MEAIYSKTARRKASPLDIPAVQVQKMAGPCGIEPQTCRLGGGRSIHLSYGPAQGLV